jgi:hypothetical protein
MGLGRDGESKSGFTPLFDGALLPRSFQTGRMLTYASIMPSVFLYLYCFSFTQQHRRASQLGLLPLFDGSLAGPLAERLTA